MALTHLLIKREDILLEFAILGFGVGINGGITSLAATSPRVTATGACLVLVGGVLMIFCLPVVFGLLVIMMAVVALFFTAAGGNDTRARMRARSVLLGRAG
jgi:hypothetical protein